MSAGGGGPWEEIGSALAGLLAAAAGILGLQRYKTSREPPPITAESQRSSSRGKSTQTLRMETTKEALHKLEERLTQNSKILSDRTSVVAEVLAGIKTLEDRLERQDKRLEEVEAANSTLRVEVAVLKDRVERSTT